MKPRSSLSPKLAILCNPALAGSYYVVVGAALDWVDPGSFLALETMFLLPVALGIFCWRRSALTFETVTSGLLLGRENIPDWLRSLSAPIPCTGLSANDRSCPLSGGEP